MSVPHQAAVTQAASMAHLPTLNPNWQPVTYTVFADGTLAVLTADGDLAGEHQRIRAAFQTSVSPDPPSRLIELGAIGTARIWTLTEGGWIERATFPLETPFPQFDRLSDGLWLVAASRSRGEPNARVLAPDGLVLDRLTLGDGIEHLAIDAEDRIWIGWFDEGMFGNDGWQVPGLEWPPSSNGVACFANDGAVFPLPIWPAEAGMIADCYALNVMGPGAWACPYTEFPLVHFVPGKPVRWWRNTLAGPRAIAIEGKHALLAGGYGEEASRLVLVELGEPGLGEEAAVLATWVLPLRRLPPSDNEWAPVWGDPSLLTGRGDTLHLVDDGVWYRWRVRDFAFSE